MTNGTGIPPLVLENVDIVEEQNSPQVKPDQVCFKFCLCDQKGFAQKHLPETEQDFATPLMSHTRKQLSNVRANLE